MGARVAKKLTAEEQSMVIRLAKVLAKVPHKGVRSNASGIASGLVRLRKDELSVADVDSVLGRYGCAGASARDVLARAGALVAAEEGGFHLALPVSAVGDVAAEVHDAGAAEAVAGPDASSAAHSGGTAGEPASPGRFGAARTPAPAREQRPGRGKHMRRADVAASTERRDVSTGHGVTPVDGRDTAVAAGRGAASPAPAPDAAASAASDKARGRFRGLLSFFSRGGGSAAGSEPEPEPVETAAPEKASVPAKTVAPAKPAAPAKAPASKKASASSRRQAANPAPAKPASSANEAAAVKPSSNVPANVGTRKLFGPGPRELSDVPHVTQHTPEATELRRKILDLDPRLWLNGWLLGWPETYTLFEDKLKALDRALAGQTTLGDGTLSCRELSYRVFGDEKFLEHNGDGRKLLERMGLADIVCHRAQPKLGLLHHIPRRRPQMRIVVTENLDPWLDVRALMYEDGRRLILGERVDGVIFGNGYLVDDARRLPEFLASLGADEVEILYWGDLDRAGLQIFDRLRRVAEGNFGLRPFVAAYAEMARRAQRRFPNPLDNEASAQEGVPFGSLDDFCAELPEDVRGYVHDVIAGNRLVPQEILTKADL